MDDQGAFSRAARILVLCAMFVIVVAGLKAASSLLVPFLLAAFLALLCLPSVRWLTGKGVPGWLGVLIVFGVFFLLGSGLFAIAGESSQKLAAKIPEYEASFNEKRTALEGWIERTFDTTVPDQWFDKALDGRKLFGMATSALAQVGGVVGNLVLVLLLLVFILAELQSLPLKMDAMRSEGAEDTGQFDRIVKNVNRYVGIKSMVSLLTGVLAGAACAIIGVDFPVLWGLIAFIMNFIPNIGSVMAAIPPVLLAILQPNLGLGEAALVAGVYAVINFVIGSALEPKLMGRSLDLSTLVVFVSLIFWGWVFGAVGMLLSVPITMVIKIALETSPTTRPIAVLLGTAPEPKPEPDPKPEPET
ncbi:MAG: AI-2E family transporter [Planctomycetota bacterium]|jgi:predicted PurR-regulated permease PerM